MDLTKQFIISHLNRLGLAELNASPYDNAFELLAAPKERKRLIFIGFNGSKFDKKHTNVSSVENAYLSPQHSSLIDGKNGEWGKTHLPKRLIEVTEELGFNVNDTIYTNALLQCSDDAKSIKSAALSTLGSLSLLIERSMTFFSDVTMQLSQPELIIAYSNGQNAFSTASILLDRFGDRDTLHYEKPASSYYSTYSFIANINEQRIPVVCIRHLSRFKPDVEVIKSAWKKQKMNLNMVDMNA